MERPSGAAVKGHALLALLLTAVTFPSAATGGDDQYRFVRPEDQTVNLSAAEGGVRFAWAGPTGASAWDTALLGVRVNAGSEPDPWIDMKSGTASLRQHLDASAQGMRWLNLSGLRAALTNGVAVDLQGHGVAIEAGNAPLRLFANKLDLGRSVLILAPHPDDAEIAAFGLYSGRNATVVTVTSGNAGDANYKDNVSDPAAHYKLKGWLRTIDSVTVPWQGGIPPERCFNLGYFDARLKEMHAKPTTVVPEMYGPNEDVSVYRKANVGRLLSIASRPSTWANLVEDLRTVLGRVKPAVIVMPHPSLDTHADHQYVAVAAIEAARRWKAPVRFLLYTNHAAENLYPYGPPETSISIPPWAGDVLTVDGVYSYPLDAETQRRKLFALESMHDLRLSPTEQASCGVPGAVRRPDYPRTPAVDYLRRGPRPEEIFFVFSHEGANGVIDSFLKREAGAPPETTR